MKYMCLVYGQEKDLHALTPQGREKLDASSLAYDRSLQVSGRFIAAEALQSVRTAKSVRRRKGRTLVTDGPFAETKEQLLGFILIEAKDLDEALEIAADIPVAEMGTVEVRAIYDIPEP
ncbi:YciI family protein [Mesorhizobium sp. LHD-90]|uniref:YciI family protein n=1 Tax=Mesorhizobium sp. LHD-90 TaxID=3071414 RepID=UPI0027DF3DAB|nr:YciI family protein [Mesorhizobium sp. LHD-90]MDQ6434033.1 YciI family protein [Mesorhizobium sp. LHD-90]